MAKNWLQEADRLEEKHKDTWQDKPDHYWLSRLIEEAGELAAALAGRHGDPVDLELAEIVSIGRNWLKKRAAENDAE